MAQMKVKSCGFHRNQVSGSNLSLAWRTVRHKGGRIQGQTGTIIFPFEHGSKWDIKMVSLPRVSLRSGSNSNCLVSLGPQQMQLTNVW